MSARSRRVERRAQARAQTRAMLGAVAPAQADGPPQLRRCAGEGCSELVAAVTVGPVQLALCPRHKAEFDRSWQRTQHGTQHGTQHDAQHGTHPGAHRRRRAGRVTAA